MVVAPSEKSVRAVPNVAPNTVLLTLLQATAIARLHRTARQLVKSALTGKPTFSVVPQWAAPCRPPRHVSRHSRALVAAKRRAHEGAAVLRTIAAAISARNVAGVIANPIRLAIWFVPARVCSIKATPLV